MHLKDDSITYIGKLR